MEVVSTSVGKFTIDLFNKLNETNKGKNIFFSPWSISAALGLTYLGAKGTTATEMAEVGSFVLLLWGKPFGFVQTHSYCREKQLCKGRLPCSMQTRAVLVVWEGDGATHCYSMGFIVTAAQHPSG